MLKKLEKNCVPKKLQPVIDIWIEKEKDFYLTWEKCTVYKGKKIKYLYEEEEITNKEWFVKYGDANIEQELEHYQIQDIAMELAKYYDTFRWSLVVDWHCNYDCKMCPYHGTGTESGKNLLLEEKEPVMSKEKAFEYIDKAKEKGIKIVSLMSKGEIFLWKDWYDVSKYIAGKGMKLWTITNGSLVTEDLCKTLKELNYTDIRVSIDAFTFDTYSKVRSKNRVYFDHAMNAPLLLKKYGITTNVHFVKQEENVNEVGLFLDYWKGQNVDSISIANQLVFGDEICCSKLEDRNIKKEFIHGICSAYGNFQTLQNGSTRFCCGTSNFREEIYDQKFKGLYMESKKIEDIIQDMNVQMSNIHSPLSEVCRKCALYVPYTDTLTEGEWMVKRNSERETWIRQN